MQIFTYIEKATESSSEGVIEDTVLLIDTMARSLSLEILGDGMIHLVVILFSVIEKRFIPTADEGITIDKHATIEMKQQVFTRVWKKRVLNTIVSVLQYILTQKAGDHEFMLSIGLVPSYVATATDIEKLQSEVLKKQSLNVTLKEYSSYLDHESSLVKTNILRKLSQLCRTHRSGIFTILQPLIAISAAGVSKEQSFAENSVLNLLKLLLGLTARDSNPSVLVECAKCIGELGAIDPSFIISQLSLQPTTGTNNEMKPWMFETLSTNSQELRPRFGIHLLVQYLVPGFKSTSSFQDRMGFAIQTILEIMKLAMQDNPVKSSAKGSVASKQSSKDREVPKALDAALTKFKIAQDTAPFFRTRYSLNDRNLIVQKPPFYTIKIENINFARWVGMWTRHLCMISTGPLMDYFQACRGAVRTRSDLCLFMLPYLIADVVSASDVASTGTPNDKFDHILLELCLVLADGDVSVLKEYSIKTTTNMVDEDGKTVSVQVDNDSVRFQGNDMAVQAVFEVLQKLSTWKTELERIRAENGRRPAPGSIASSNSRNSTPPFTQAMNSMLYGIKNLLSKIPKSLLGQAAYRTKAYASALKFFESHVRQQAVSNRATLTSISNNASSMYGERNDGSNFGLPLLSLSELDQFMAIYSELDDPDALQGFLVLRQIQGYPANYWTRIKEFEQTENWVAALNEYGAAHNQAFNTLSEENVETGATLVDMNTSTLAQSSSSSNAAMINSRTPFPSNQQQVPAHTTESGSNAALKRRLSFGIPASTNKSSSFFVDQTKVFSTPHSNRKRGTPHSGSSVKDNSKSKNPVSTLPSAKNGTSAQKGIQTAYGRSDRHSSMDNDNTVELDENDGDDDPQTDESLSLTKGRLRCLVELGHLDSVIEQVIIKTNFTIRFYYADNNFLLTFPNLY